MKKGDAFLITADTTYQEIADYLVKSDPAGIDDLINIILDKKPELVQELKTWEMFK